MWFLENLRVSFRRLSTHCRTEAPKAHGISVLLPGELEQWRDVPCVGLSERINISASHGAGLAQLSLSPGEILAAVEMKKQIAGEASMPTIAIGKRMDFREPMVKMNRALIKRITAMLKLCLHVFTKVVKLGRDLIGKHADIFLADSKSAGPPPDIHKHFPMKKLQAVIGE